MLNQHLPLVPLGLLLAGVGYPPEPEEFERCGTWRGSVRADGFDGPYGTS